MKFIILFWLLIACIVLACTANAATLNNPGNIEKGTNWVGLSSDQPHKRFAKFKSPVYGYRAMAKILLTYNEKYKLQSVTELITRYAPPSENPTTAYIQYVVLTNGFTSWSYINVKNENVLFWMVRSMAQFEQGKNFHDSDATIRAGVRMALNGN